MDPLMRFERIVRENPQLRLYVQGLDLDTPAVERRSLSGLEGAFALAIVAGLWKLMNLGLSHIRSAMEDERARTRAEMIVFLTERVGMEPAQAEQAARRIYADVAQRSEDDAVLKALLEAYKKAGE